jgi:hypothetical protein
VDFVNGACSFNKQKLNTNLYKLNNIWDVEVVVPPKMVCQVGVKAMAAAKVAVAIE